MEIELKPAKLCGTIEAVSSKSDVHRALIAAAFAGNACKIKSNICSKDMEATMRCLNALGAKLRYDKTETCFLTEPVPKNNMRQFSAFAQPEKSSDAPAVLDCGESGSTLRFLLPVAAAMGKDVMFTGSGRLPERPVDVLLRAMEPHGVKATQDHLPLCLTGSLTPGVFTLPGNVSSQYITGLLLAFPLLSGASSVKLTNRLESHAYVSMTLDTMRRFGVTIQETENGYSYAPEKSKFADAPYHAPKQYTADGDWSNAAFFLAAAFLNEVLLGAEKNSISVQGLRKNSVQGDRKISELLDAMRAYLLNGACGTFSVDASEIPDLVPILSVAMALSPRGTFAVTHAKRLRLKECDRLSAIAAGLLALNIPVTEQPDGLLIKGSGRPRGSVTLNGCNDHRMVMAFAIAAAFCKTPVAVTDAQAVEKSYPAFFDDYRKLGGIFDGI